MPPSTSRESVVLDDAFAAFAHKGFAVLPRDGWARPVPVEENRRGVVWRENVGGFRVGKRLVRVGFSGRADIGGFTKGGRFIAFEVKRHERGRLSPMQVCWRDWMSHMNVAWALVWSYDSTMDAIKELDL